MSGAATYKGVVTVTRELLDDDNAAIQIIGRQVLDMLRRNVELHDGAAVVVMVHTP